MGKILTNSLIFGGNELGKLGVIEKVDRPFIPPINIVEKEILGKDGSIYKSLKVDPLLITASIRLFNDITRNIDDIIFDLMELVYSRELKTLNYRGKRVWYDAILVDVNNHGKFRQDYAYMDLIFKVPSGLGRSEFMRDEYKDFTSEEINISSVLPSKGIFTFTGSTNKITNKRTGEFIEILSGASGNFVIDCDKEIVTINGKPAMDRVSLYSDFFKIINGDIIKTKYNVSLKFYENYLYDR